MLEQVSEVVNLFACWWLLRVRREKEGEEEARCSLMARLRDML